MILAHKIALDPTPEQEEYFRKAAGTARTVWNWALHRWQETWEKSGKWPKWQDLQKDFNAQKQTVFPWIDEIGCWPYHKVFPDLAKAFSAYAQKLRSGEISRLKANRRKRGRKVSLRLGQPRFKSRKFSRPSFYVHNQSLKAPEGEKRVRIPKAGWIRTRENLRFRNPGAKHFEGIQGARISRHGDRWYISIQVEMGDVHRTRAANGTIGVDLGISALATLSTGEQIAGPKPLDAQLRRLKRLGRKLSRSKEGLEQQRETEASHFAAPCEDREHSSCNTPPADDPSLPREPSGRDRGPWHS